MDGQNNQPKAKDARDQQWDLMMAAMECRDHARDMHIEYRDARERGEKRDGQPISYAVVTGLWNIYLEQQGVFLRTCFQWKNAWVDHEIGLRAIMRVPVNIIAPKPLNKDPNQ